MGASIGRPQVVGFKVVSSFAVHTESVGSVIAKGKASLMSSAVLACRKNPADGEECFETVMANMAEKVGGAVMIKPFNEVQLCDLSKADGNSLYGQLLYLERAAL